MNHANSIVLGGQIVEAIDCGYQDYLDLLLLCPACKEPVYLCQEYCRSFKQEVINVKSHFRHFKKTDTHTKCDERVNNISQAEIAKQESISRNQRLKFFKLRMWEILTRSPYIGMEQLEIERALQNKNYLLPEQYQAQAEKIWSQFYRSIVARIKKIRQPQFYDNWINPTIEQVYKARSSINIANPASSNSQVETRTISFINRINLNLQKQICAEVIDYLALHMSRATLENLITLCWLKVSTDDFKEDTATDIADRIIRQIILIVITTLWSEEFARYYQGHEYDKIADLVQSRRFYCQALKRVLDEDYQGAIDLFSKAVELDPDNSEAYKGRANCYGMMSNYEVALTEYSKVIKLEPKNSINYTNRANVRFLSGDSEGALKDYSKAIKLNPYEILAYVNRASAFYELKDYESAIKDFTKVIQLDPEDTEAYKKLVNARIKLGDFEVAIADYGKVIELAPTDNIAFNGRGIAYLKLGNFEAAIADFTKAIQLDLEEPTNYINRGTALQKLGLQQEAQQDLQKGKDLLQKQKQEFAPEDIVLCGAEMLEPKEQETAKEGFANFLKQISQRF